LTVLVAVNVYNTDTIKLILEKGGNLMEEAQIVLERHEQKIDAIETQPKARMQQVTAAIAAALTGGLISAVVGWIVP